MLSPGPKNPFPFFAALHTVKIKDFTPIATFCLGGSMKSIHRPIA
jgi:anthranilate/para-aminobenzoate synthase component II